jgi:Protein of unknown function (DUF2846)
MISTFRLMGLTATVPILVVLAAGTLLADDASPKGNTGITHDGKAKVYFYRYKQFTGAALEPSVYCDEIQLARMDNGRYFVAQLDPGVHTLRANDKQSGIELKLEPGGDYYVRIELVTGFWKGHGRLVSVPREQGSFEVRKLKPLASEKIKDPSRVSAPTL